MHVFIIIPLFFAVLPAFAWSWRSLLVIILIAGSFLGILWADHAHEAMKPGYDSGPFGFFGIAIFAISTIAFVAMVASRALGLWFQRNGLSRLSVIWTDAFGIIITLLILFIPSIIEQYDRRLPTQACLNSALQIQTGKIDFQLPKIPILSIYFDNNIRESARYLFSPKHQRDLCQRTKNGNQSISVPLFALHFRNATTHRNSSTGKKLCNHKNYSWIKELCTVSYKDIELLFPENLIIYQPGTIESGGFGINAPTYSQYKKSRKVHVWKDRALVLEANGKVERYSDGFFIVRKNLTSKDTPLAAHCRASFSDIKHCKVDYKMDNGLGVHWSFSAKENEISLILIQLHKKVQEVLTSVYSQPS